MNQDPKDPKVLLAVDPGSQNLGAALCRMSGNRLEVPSVWQGAVPSGKLPKRLRWLATWFPMVVYDALDGGAQALAIEEPPTTWKDDGTGRKDQQWSTLVLGIVIGQVIQTWYMLTDRPVYLVPVGQWRYTLRGVFQRSASGDWKAPAVRAVRALTGQDPPSVDVAEAALLGLACLAEPSLLAHSNRTNRSHGTSRAKGLRNTASGIQLQNYRGILGRYKRP